MSDKPAEPNGTAQESTRSNRRRSALSRQFTMYLTAKVDPDLDAEVRQHAHDADRTVSSVVRRALRAYLAPNPTGVPYPPNPPENPPHPFIPGSPGWLAYERGRAAADSWWRSRLVSDETVEAVATDLARIAGSDYHWQNYAGAARRLIAASLLPVNGPETCGYELIRCGCGLPLNHEGACADGQ